MSAPGPKGTPYDLVVCGGGITGAGIARDAALRGLRVCLLDKGDFGSGTSCKSSKLIHGGLRYLEQGELRLVFEGTNERALLMRRAPHLVRPVPFMVPIYKRRKPGLATIDFGLWIYDALAMFRSPRLHKTYRGQKATKLEPCLGGEGLAGALEYYDCFTDDARLVIENVLDARTLGADVRSYTKVTGFTRRPSGRVTGVLTTDVITGAQTELATHAVIVAAGPWTDVFLAETGLNDRLESAPRRLLAPTKGVHIVVDHARLPVKRAIAMFTNDNRVLFALPWDERTVLGTTDTFSDEAPEHVAADAADVDYICRNANQFFPDAQLSAADVIATWAGLRPLIAPPERESASDVSREHEVYVRDEGVVIIAGGKLTTYRRMASHALDKAVEFLQDHPSQPLGGRKIDRCKTKHRSLPGAQGLPEQTPRKTIAALVESLTGPYGLTPRVATHLAESYGIRAKTLLDEAPAADRTAIEDGLPYLWAEVAFAATHDIARTLEDVLGRRIPLLLRGRDQGLDVAPEIAARLGKLLGWDATRSEHELAAYATEVARSRQFRSPA